MCSPTFPAFLGYFLPCLLIRGPTVLVLTAAHGPERRRTLPPSPASLALGLAFVTSGLPRPGEGTPPTYKVSFLPSQKVRDLSKRWGLFINKVSKGIDSRTSGSRPLLFLPSLESTWCLVQVRELPLSSCLQRRPKFICLRVFWGH